MGKNEWIIDGEIRINGSCSTMLNGDAYIFGGGTDKRQVNKYGLLLQVIITICRSRSLPIVEFRDWATLNSISILDLAEHLLSKTGR